MYLPNTDELAISYELINASFIFLKRSKGLFEMASKPYRVCQMKSNANSGGEGSMSIGMLRCRKIRRKRYQETDSTADVSSILIEAGAVAQIDQIER